MNRRQMREDALAKANQIVDAAKKAGRTNLTRTEAGAIEGYLADVDRLDQELKQEAADAQLLKSLSGIPASAVDEHTAQLAGSGAKATLLDALQRKTPVAVRMSPAELKAGFSTATVTGAGLVPFTDADLRTPPPGSGAVDLTHLLKNTGTDQGSVRVYHVGAMSGMAVVAEGATKPEMTGTASAEDVALVKLAGYFKTTLEFVQDAPKLLDRILSQAHLELTRKRNGLVLDALTNASGAEVISGSKSAALDLIADAVGNYESRNGLTPEFLVASPTDLAALRKLKGTDGQYFINPFQAGGTGPFGLSVAPVPGMTPGTMFVGSRDAGTWYQHESGVMVQNGWEGTDLIDNKVTTVIEQRGLAVADQGHFLTKITLTA